MTKRAGLVRRWMVENPLVWGTAIISFALGALLAYPLFGWELTETAATLVGSMAGAALAVAGALWVHAVNESDRRQSVVDRLIAVIQPLKYLGDKLLQRETMPLAEGETYAARVVSTGQLAELHDAAETLLRRVGQMTPFLVGFEYSGIKRILELEEIVSDLAAHMSPYRSMPSHPLGATDRAWIGPTERAVDALGKCITFFLTRPPYGNVHEWASRLEAEED